MQLSVDQKIQAAIQPLLQRITALEADNNKHKLEIAALQIATQPKVVTKPGIKPLVEPVRPETVKGTRRKSLQKPQPKADKSGAGKKQEIKGEHEEGKVENGKTRTPAPGQKIVPSPAVQKDSNTSNDKKIIQKKPIDRPPTALTGGRKNPDLTNNKSTIHDKKTPVTKGTEQIQKKEGDEKLDQSKKHVGEKIETKITSNHNIKTPVVNKGKGVVADKKTGPATPVGATNKKIGKAHQQPTKSPEVKTEEVKQVEGTQNVHNDQTVAQTASIPVESKKQQVVPVQTEAPAEKIEQAPVVVETHPEQKVEEAAAVVQSVAVEQPVVHTEQNPTVHVQGESF